VDGWLTTCRPLFLVAAGLRALGESPHWCQQFINGYPKESNSLRYPWSNRCIATAVEQANLVFVPLGVIRLALLARLLGCSRPWATWWRRAGSSCR